MPKGPPQQVLVGCSTAIPGLVHGSRRVLARVDRLTTALAAVDLGPDAIEASQKLRLVIECGHHHMPPLPPLWVVPVMVDDEAPDVVGLGVDLRHRPRVNLASPPVRRHHRQDQPGQEPARLLKTTARTAR